MNSVRLWLRFVGASFRSQAQYPASTVMLAIGHFIMTSTEILGVWALFDRFGNVRGWGFGDVAVFYALVNIMFALADMISRGFDVLGTDLLRTGNFDRLLLRPRSLMLQLMGHDVRISRMSRLVQGVIVLILGSSMQGIEWSVADVAMAVWAIVGGTALFMGLFVLQGTLTFWTVESLEVINVLTYGGVQAAQFPMSLYGSGLRGLLTYVIPLACVAYFPVLTILGKPDPLGTPAWLGPVAPLAGIAFLGVACMVWRLGVRHYTSTGS